VTLLVLACMLWPFVVLAPLAGAGPAEVRLVQDDRTADLGVAYGPGGAWGVAERTRLVVDQASAALLKGSSTGTGEQLDPSALASSGIPEVAVRAYEAAEATLAAEDPGCGLAWWLLAGIGRVESNHGQFAGAVLLEDGTSAPPVVGIPLDGRPGVALIRDTDGGALDGDTTFDRAVGPMQFIPSTWAGSQADGDGDGTADPHDLDDAALASGRYLCAGEADLTTEAGLRAAVFRYNHSDAYVDLVLAVGRAYASGAVPVIPAGDAAAATTAGPAPSTTTPAPTASSPTATAAPTTSPTTAPTTTVPTTTPPPSPTTSPTTPPATSPTGGPTPTCTPEPAATPSPTGEPTATPTGGPTTPPTCPPCPTDAPTTSPTDGPVPSPTCTVPTTSPTGTATTTP
jgi:hypothetical protein